jgi:hypothetical protein
MLYRVHVSENHKHIVEADTLQEAKRIAWREIAPEGRFKYGWLDWYDFNSNVKVTEEEYSG